MKPRIGREVAFIRAKSQVWFGSTNRTPSSGRLFPKRFILGCPPIGLLNDATMVEYSNSDGRAKCLKLKHKLRHSETSLSGPGIA
jgi:hypothetical protein